MNEYVYFWFRALSLLFRLLNYHLLTAKLDGSDSFLTKLTQAAESQLPDKKKMNPFKTAAAFHGPSEHEN